ncbi:hypothetical protein DVA86_13025 [Streptomyces armeniacus]|uniref:Prenyltransferase n=1 Tax=Streptomyces armeniacus TaxID=83291 RepID=A0A345XP74_9ACTN|nr:hypothetical protein [Streptomyces armeniacus]AXK33440.1 hypothetical protein DVA86_13025 [Streptomyces armeniacus]
MDTKKPDLTAATAFMTTHARLLDRRRLELLLGRCTPDAVIAALDAYRNPDGGYGWGLEPDLRARGSQPVAALHAFEPLAECGPETYPQAKAVCDWLESVALPDGGMPFALPMEGPDLAGAAPFWAAADPAAPSLHMTAVVAGAAHRVGRHDPAVRDHRWLARATDFCRRAIAALDAPPHAIEFRFVLDLLDTLHGTHDWAGPELERLAAWLPHTGRMAVEGGAEGESMRPLDFAPLPDRPLRRLIDAEVISAELDRLAAGQQHDGGWAVDFAAQSPAGALEWRGYATVGAVTVLRANGRL